VFSVLAIGEAISAAVEDLLNLFVFVDGDKTATHEAILQQNTAAVDCEEKFGEKDVLLGAFVLG
jgi:hypothetical protein